MHQIPSTPYSLRSARIAIAMFFFVSGFSFGSWASRIPSLQQKLAINNATLGSVLFALPLGLLCTLPFTGYLLDKYGSRYSLMLGSVLYSIMLCLIGSVSHVWQFVLVLFFFGSSRNLMNISVNTQSVGLQSLYNKSIVASFHGIWSLAGFIAAAIGSWMISNDIPTQIHLFIASICSLMILLFSFKYTLQNDTSTSTSKRKVFVLPHHSLLNLGFIAFCGMIIEGTLYDWSGIYFKNEVHASKEFIGLGYVVFTATMALGRFVGDAVANKIGVKKVISISGLMVMTGLSLSIIFPNLISCLLGFSLAGLGISCIVPHVMGLSGKSKLVARGTAIASVSTISYFGFLIGPPIIGYVAQSLNLRIAFILVALAGACMWWLSRFIKLED